MLLQDVLDAHAYARNVLQDIDAPELQESPDRMAEVVYSVLWNGIVNDPSEPVGTRYAAAVAQHVYAGHSEAQIVEAIGNDAAFRDLLATAVAKEPERARNGSAVVHTDCVATIRQCLECA